MVDWAAAERTTIYVWTDYNVRWSQVVRRRRSRSLSRASLRRCVTEVADSEVTGRNEQVLWELKTRSFNMLLPLMVEGMGRAMGFRIIDKCFLRVLEIKNRIA